MKKILIFPFLILISSMSWSCIKEDADREEIVEMTIYPETGSNGYFLSDNVYGEFYFISDTEDQDKRLLQATILEQFEDFKYEHGNQYTLRAKKVWMSNPPQDVSSIKFIYLSTLSKEKLITEDRSEEMTIIVRSNTVNYLPLSEVLVEEALLIHKIGDLNFFPVKAIEGFNYVSGYEYKLKIKKIVEANPYNIQYVLLEEISKEEK